MPRPNAVIYSLPGAVELDGADLVLPIPVPADGAYTLALDFLNNTLNLEAFLSQGDNATFSPEVLQPGFIYVGHLLDSNGHPVQFSIDGRTFDGIEFATR